MSHRVILAGLSTCLLALTFGFTQTANAQERLCWIDAKTGETPQLGPPYWRGPIEQPQQFSSGGHNYAKLANGTWIDAKTGETPQLGPPYWRGPIEQPQQFSSGGHNYVRVPCPPQNASIGLNLGVNPVLVLGGNVGGGWSRNSYSDFPTFDGSGAGGGVYGVARYYVQPNFFVGPEGGFMLLDINARNLDSAFGFVRNQAYLGGQGGVTFQGPGATKVNLYSGLDATWSRVTVGVDLLNERMSKNLGGWSVHGGVELQPIPSIPTLWLGLDLRHSDVSGTIGGDPTRVQWNMLSVTLSIQR